MTAGQAIIKRAAAWLRFQTFNDSQLEKMAVLATQFVRDVRDRKPLPWLVLSGSSGAGKSHIARRIWRWWQADGRWYVNSNGGNSSMPGQFCLWGDFIDHCRNGDFSGMDDLSDDHFVVLDDIAAGSDARKWMADKLYMILERRQHTPYRPMHSSAPRMTATLITANLSVEQLAEVYDSRVASRLIRQGQDRVVQVQVQDFARRPRETICIPQPKPRSHFKK
jgi:hypothetical protein